MRPVAVIDAETDPFRKGRIPSPFLWGFYDGSQYHQFHKTSEVIEFIREYDGIIYAHNGGKFDFHYLLPALSEYDDLTIINGRIAKCYIGAAELRDSYCIINEPLDKYKKTKIDYALFEKNERDKPKNFAKISAYLKDDCVYLWELVTGFITRFGNHLTQASAAMRLWGKMSKDPVEATDVEFYDLFAPYYYGGRVQCFESGIIDEDFHVYDINSAYPYAMLHDHPYSPNFEHSSAYIRNADFVSVECISDGAFPYRGSVLRNDGSVSSGLDFPCDDVRRVYTVTGWEYLAAQETNTIHKAKIIESFRFVRHRNFGEYIDHFWKLREKAKAEGNILDSLFSKLMMNSLYGKFAANPENYQNYIIISPEKSNVLGATGSEWQFAGELGPWCLASSDLAEYEKKYYNVATGASITGFVRAYLWRALCSNRAGNLYCDTDSIATRHAGDFIRIGGALGDWKDENANGFDKAGIGGKKVYIMRGKPDAEGKRQYKTASKGARLTNSQLWQVARGEVVEYSPMVPTYSVKSKSKTMIDVDGKQQRIGAQFVKRDIRRTA